MIHHTFYLPGYLGRPTSGARVTTVYDMIPELLPDHFPRGNPHQGKEEYVRNSDAVLAISHSAKKDLLDIYGEIDAPVMVSHLGVDRGFFARPDGPPGRSRPYLLFVGARRGYKHFLTLLTAMSQVVDVFPELELVCAGGGPFSEEERLKLEQFDIAARQVDVDDDMLAALYRSAVCFVFPSVYEGFGLPTLEAMASGCPVVLADSSSHPEVGGDAARFFAPGDADSLADVVISLVADETLRTRMASEGVKRASTFTWERTARATLSAYESTMASR